MRLIDADSLIETLNKECGWENTKDIQVKIMEQPTAYDVDKVMEELKEIQQEILPMVDNSDYFIGQLTLINRIIPLVKRGGQG